VVALPLSDVDASVSRLVRVEIIVTAAVLGLLALVTYWVLRLGVRPVKTMTATATAIAAGDLSQRVPDVATGTEAGELGLALNQMMTRIEEAFDERTRSENRLRRFAADASHELRTPVATVRGYAELYRAGGLEDPQDLADAMRRTEQEAVRMGSLIDDLLLLARLDQGRPLDHHPVDLGALARDAVADARVVHPERLLEADAPAPVVVDGDDGRLRQVVANLVGNALVHSSPDAAVRVRARLDGTDAVLEVTDEGPGMDAEVAQQAFERFYRADPSRSRHQGGSGLGLSIVDAISVAHGGRAELRTAPGEGTTVRIVLPAATPVTAPPPA
jgi:two-component system OmpR family sensor kinase